MLSGDCSVPSLSQVCAEEEGPRSLQARTLPLPPQSKPIQGPSLLNHTLQGTLGLDLGDEGSPFSVVSHPYLISFLLVIAASQAASPTK